jgi:hypothetical protein
MKIANHLSDAEITEIILGHGQCNAHVTDCAICQKEILRLRQMAVNLHRLTPLTEVRPEEFWRHQRESIWKRIGITEKVPRRKLPILAWTSAAAALAAIILFIHEGRTPVHPRAEKDPDHELLLHVEHTIASDGPSALEPAGLLAQEISENSSAVTDLSSQGRTQKEKKTNEN